MGQLRCRARRRPTIQARWRRLRAHAGIGHHRGRPRPLRERRNWRARTGSPRDPRITRHLRRTLAVWNRRPVLRARRGAGLDQSRHETRNNGALPRRAVRDGHGRPFSVRARDDRTANGRTRRVLRLLFEEAQARDHDRDSERDIAGQSQRRRRVEADSRIKARAEIRAALRTRRHERP